MSVFVLDTSALLAVLQGEPGAERVAGMLLSGRCCLSAVNLAEFATKCLGGGMSAADFATVMSGFEVEVVPLDRAQALLIGELRQPTRQPGLSLGDRACLALAQQRAATAVTADRAWTTLDLGIAVDCIRSDAP